jgi:hypothetical protein
MTETRYSAQVSEIDGPSAGSKVEESRLKAGCSQDWPPHKRRTN